MRVHSREEYLSGDNEATIIYRKGEGVCTLSCGDGFLARLPSHPRAGGRFSPILPDDVAGHVLTKLEPQLGDVDADVHVARGYVRGSKEPIVTAVWFKADLTQPATDMKRIFARIRGRATAQASKGEQSSKERVYVSSGVYMESGLGILAGRGRRTVTIDGKARSVPFHRSSHSDDEGLLSELMSGVAKVIQRVDAKMVSHEHKLMIERGHQYPRQHLHGDAFIRCHQVVIRCWGGPDDPQGSDLHVDTMDGRGNAGGAWTIYSGELPSAFDHLAVFETAQGGCGYDVRVGGYGSDWACAVHLDTANRLHGSVWPREPKICGTKVGFGLRIVTYTLRRIEMLEESVRASPDEEQTAVDASTEVVKRRMLGQW